MTAHRGHARFLVAAGRCRAAGKSVADEFLRAEWESVDAIKLDAEPPLKRLYARLLREQEEAVLGRLGDVVKAAPDRRDVLLGTVLLDPDVWSAWVLAEFGPALAAVVLDGFRTGALRVGTLDLTPRVGPYGQSVLDRTLAKVDGASLTTQGEVGRVVRDALEAGDDADAIAKKVRQAFDGWTTTRAETVARTSATATFEAGQLVGFGDAGADAKRWLSQRDGEVRDGHDEADGQEVEVDDPFEVAGEALMHPGDPAGSAGNVIRCRCTSLPVVRQKSQPGPLDLRDEAIRRAYPGEKSRAKAEGLTAEVARERLGVAHGLSERQVRRILQSGARA